jgi:chorismate synthase
VNTTGRILRLTTFGESHGIAIGGILDGFPAGCPVDLLRVEREMNRRKPGQSALTTERKEADEVEFLSGLFEGLSTGAPIAFLIRNKDMQSSDYEHLKNVFRPSHADFTYQAKYGIRDHRGGGRSSARETAVRVAAGALCLSLLEQKGITIQGYVSQVGDVKCTLPYTALDLGKTDDFSVRCPEEETAIKMENLIAQIKEEGDSIGGAVSCVIRGVSSGLGAPIYGKLHADLASAMMSINAAKGFDYGSGFDMLHLPGSALNDPFESAEGKIRSIQNNSGGIQGGISNGEDIYFRVAFKPVATIKKTQQTTGLSGEPTELTVTGRHDPCVLPRAVPIVEAMSALVILDHLLLSKTITFPE